MQSDKPKRSFTAFRRDLLHPCTCKCDPWHLCAERVAGVERGGWYTFNNVREEVAIQSVDTVLLCSLTFFIVLFQNQEPHHLLLFIRDVPLGAAVKNKCRATWFSLWKVLMTAVHGL